jgi:triosephosphate isomerase
MIDHEYFYYIANWKMNKSYLEAWAWIREHKKRLSDLSRDYFAHIVICPSFVSLGRFVEELQDTSLSLGAQNCSDHPAGAYTSEVDARSLQEIGCNYCIIGHKERQLYYGETTESIARKLPLLLTNNITPIICIGEKKQLKSTAHIYLELEQQLAPLITVLTENTVIEQKKICLAYEPWWAVGSGDYPKPEVLQDILAWLSDYCMPLDPAYEIILLYGGSVTDIIAQKYDSLPFLNGYLIGSASLELQKFEKIISLRRTSNPRIL